MQVTSQHNYCPVVATAHNCVGAVIEMIATAEGFELDQLSIARFFGIHTPTAVDEHEIEDLDPSHYGVVFGERTINDLFEEYKVSLKETYVPINRISEDYFEEYLADKIREQSHVVCGYTYGILRDTPLGTGHVSLVLSVDEDMLRIYDPGPREPGNRHVKSTSMYKAISHKKDGIWVIKRV